MIISLGVARVTYMCDVNDHIIIILYTMSIYGNVYDTV